MAGTIEHQNNFFTQPYLFLFLNNSKISLLLKFILSVHYHQHRHDISIVFPVHPHHCHNRISIVFLPPPPSHHICIVFPHHDHRHNRTTFHNHTFHHHHYHHQLFIVFVLLPTHPFIPILFMRLRQKAEAPLALMYNLRQFMTFLRQKRLISSLLYYLERKIFYLKL